MGDFNFSVEKWETFENGGENMEGNKLLRLTMNKTMVQYRYLLNYKCYETSWQGAKTP